MVPLLLLVTFGPLLQWKRDGLKPLFSRVKWPAVAALGTGLAALIVLGPKAVLSALGFALAIWLTGGAAALLVRRWVSLRSLRTTPFSVYGMALAHAGLGITVAGITAMSGFEVTKVLVMRPGETASVGDARVTLTGIRDVTGGNYVAQQASFSARQGNTIRRPDVGAAFLPQQPQPDDRGGHRRRAGGQYLCRDRRARSDRAASPCAFTTTRSSAGSGAARS